MDRLVQPLLAQLLETGGTELAAVLLGLVYVGLAIRQHRSCWIAGGLSTAAYILVFVDARLYLQAALMVLYVVLSVKGWLDWGRDAGDGMTTRPVSLRRQLLMLAAVALLTLASAPLLAHWSDSAAPWADALGTWASVAATWLMIRKVAAAWLWWLVIDPALALFYASQGLMFSTLLYLVFGAMALVGWRSWRRAPAVVADG